VPHSPRTLSLNTACSILANKGAAGKSVRRSMRQAFGIISFVLVLSLVFPLTMASAGWTRTYPGIDMDILTPTSVVQTLDGGYATAIHGYLRRYDSAGGPFTSSYELQILKTDSNGGVQWKRSYPTVEDPNHVTPTIYTDSEHYTIVQTADQGYVVAGGGFWLFKVDSQGSVLWSKTYQLNDESYSYGQFYSMIQTGDGGFALTGTVETYDGGSDFWLIKTNSVGAAQWNHTYNSGTYTDSGGYVNSREDIAKSVIQTSDGGYALVGSASLFRASTSSVVYSSWVVKTDAQGKQLWNKGYDLLNDQGYEYIIIQTSDGGYAIAGTENSDFCLFKTSSTSQLEWSKIYGDSQTDNPCSLVQLEDGGYAIAGTWNPTNMTATRPTMGLLRTDSSGQTLWIKTYSARENGTSYSVEQARAMIRTSDGSYAIVGNTQFPGETHGDVFFVKTETLEQPPQIKPLPTPATSDPSSNTQTPGQTSNQTQSDPGSTTTGDDKTKPTANAGPDQAVDKGTQVTLDGSACSDNVGIVNYTWTFTDVTTKTLSGINPSYTFSAPGVYIITLSVKDATGNEASDTIVVTVSEAGAFPSLLIGAAAAGIAAVAAPAFLLLWRRRRIASQEDKLK